MHISFKANSDSTNLKDIAFHSKVTPYYQDHKQLQTQRAQGCLALKSNPQYQDHKQLQTKRAQEKTTQSLLSI